ncbi:MAG: SMP-30/gluconolactonase/LRE family protein, partial [Actinomycetota bacterium]
QTTYATIPDLAPCAIASAARCSPGAFSALPTWANDIAFGPDGSAYVTDLQASTIFRVPPGGGDATIWYRDRRFDSVFGLNGITVNPDGDRLLFALTGSLQPTTPLQGIVYSLPIVASPQPADLEVFHVFTQPVAGPDGIAFGASGRLYVILAGSNQMAILDPDGSEVATFPNPVTNLTQDIPYDAPASAAFDGAGSLLITNHAFFTGLGSHWAVLRAFVNDTAA